MLQWEWLGGLPPIRRAAIIGAGTWGTSLAVSLARAGFEVDLGCRTHEQAAELAAATTQRALPARRRAARLDPRDARRRARAVDRRPRLPRGAGEGAAGGARRARRADRAARPACSCWPRAWYRRSARCRRRSSPSAAAPARWPCWAVPRAAPDLLEHGASIVLASLDGAFARQLAETLRDCQTGRDRHQRRHRRRARGHSHERRRAGRRRRIGRRCQRRRSGRGQGVRRGRRAGAAARRASRDIRRAGRCGRSRRRGRVQVIAQPPRR